VNSVCLTGRLISEPTSRAAVGQRVVRFRLAVDDAARKPTHVEVECWGPVARSVETYLSKNRRVAIQGRLTRAAWQGNGAGECRHERVLVTARMVDFLDRRGRDRNRT
jgi:single-stranded DNA-binding protein